MKAEAKKIGVKDGHISVGDADWNFQDETKTSGVTFDGFLNALDGVEALDGLAVFVTTNFPDQVDDAIKREGRCGVHCHLSGLDLDGKRRLVKRVVEGPDGPEDADAVDYIMASTTPEETPAALRGRAIQIAVERRWASRGKMAS